MAAHYFIDSTHIVTAAGACATVLAAELLLVNDIREQYNRHVGAAITIRDFTLTITRGYVPYYAQDMVPCDVVEGRGAVDLDCTLLFDNDQRLLYDWLMFGDPNAAAGSEMTEVIFANGRFGALFTSDPVGANARTLSVAIPTIQWEATGIGDAVGPDVGGGPMQVSVKGHATATTPITIVLTNAVAAY